MNLRTKILVISHNAFSNNANNGKTLKSLFSSYPFGDVAQLFFSQNEYPDFDFCNKYFKITDLDVLKNLISKSRKNGKVLSYSEKNDCINTTRKIKKNGLWSFAKRMSPYIITLRDFLWKTGAWKTSALFNWIDYFKPDLIFYCGGMSGFSHEIAVYLKNKLDIPLVSYFTDDYIINPINRNIFDKIQRSRIESIYLKTIKESSLLFVIGDLMAYEYSNYFNKPFFPIMNSVPNEMFDYFNDNKLAANNNIVKISYFGGLHLKRWKMISHLASIISDISNTLSYTVEFRVFTNSDITDEIKKEFARSSVLLEEPLTGNELIKEMVNTDILLHVESDDPFYKSLTKLSVSTKIPEYLLTKNILLAFGPSEVASIRLISDNDIGMVIDSRDTEEVITTKIVGLINKKNFRSEIGSKGYDYARSNFDASIIRAEFMNKINELQNHSKLQQDRLNKL